MLDLDLAVDGRGQSLTGERFRVRCCLAWEFLFHETV
jgi:hypothetical protein